ncbi:sulfate ABC transporter substrate-binding protein [Laribacter hongkongensis]|uniref:sulfate ABC transporter substrate-binding protein n=1 Tax=Laribacter hongkongensis TaxID=168471 RepID=UPI001EFC8322|nr:sulfate ABC transporter substrate-binding protein [Laribacter hongkongensis]MCG9096878.1 sulfate ABC transporter substrate-binding protein [Laribacter hongkongensis]
MKSRSLFGTAALLLWSATTMADTTLLNVSYDPTRELYKDINSDFSRDWLQRGGEALTIKQSHGGSAKQARSVIDGLEADVVTLALASDIDEIARLTGKLPAGWQKRLPHNSTPFTSTIVFLVRKGNPKQIHDWSDLVRPGVQVITPNPKTSGGARWNYLAAYAWAKRQPGATEASAQQYLRRLYANVPVLDTGARGATMTFVQRGMGDVLLAWENEALMARNELGPDKFDLVVPPLSIKAEPPVALVDKVADRHGTRKVAEAYLRYLYTPAAQRIAVRHFYRPTDPAVAQESATGFPSVRLVTISELGGWPAVQDKHFSDGGVFDQILAR